MPGRVPEYPLSDSLLHKRTSDGLNGEAFNGTFKSSCKGKGSGAEVHFIANGTATGPYAGAFVAKGSWFLVSSAESVFSFRERFEITSGNRTIHGHIREIGSTVGNCNYLRAGVHGLKYFAYAHSWMGATSAHIGYYMTFKERFR